MAQDLGLDTALTELGNLTGNATGWASRVQSILDSLAESSGNPWGSAALKDTGTASGDIPLLGAGGLLARERLPAASETEAGILEIASNAEMVAGTDNTRVITPLRLQEKVATTTQRGLVRKATTAERDAGTSSEAVASIADANHIAFAKARNLGLAGEAIANSSGGTSLSFSHNITDAEFLLVGWEEQNVVESEFVPGHHYVRSQYTMSSMVPLDSITFGQFTANHEHEAGYIRLLADEDSRDLGIFATDGQPSTSLKFRAYKSNIRLTGVIAFGAP